MKFDVSCRVLFNFYAHLLLLSFLYVLYKILRFDLIHCWDLEFEKVFKRREYFYWTFHWCYWSSFQRRKLYRDRIILIYIFLVGELFEILYFISTAKWYLITLKYLFWFKILRLECPDHDPAFSLLIKHIYIGYIKSIWRKKFKKIWIWCPWWPDIISLIAPDIRQMDNPFSVR